MLVVLCVSVRAQCGVDVRDDVICKSVMCGILRYVSYIYYVLGTMDYVLCTVHHVLLIMYYVPHSRHKREKHDR